MTERPRARADRHDLVRPEAAGRLGEQRLRGRIRRVADDRDLDGRRQREVERHEPLGEPGRIALEIRRDRPERALRRIAIAALAGPRRQSQQDERRHRVPRRDRVVLRVLGTGHEPLVVVGRCRRIRRPDRRSGRGRGPSARGPSRTIARRRSPRRGRAGPRRGACSPRGRPGRSRGRPSTTGPGQPSAREEAAQDRLGRADGRVREARLPEEPARVGERPDREPVPGGERLVVALRLRPGRAPLEQRRPRAARAPSSSAGSRAVGRRVESGQTRERIVRPSQLPSSVTPYAARNGSASAPRTSRISAAVQMNVSPSTPSVSASWLAANAPSAAPARGACSRGPRARPHGSARPPSRPRRGGRPARAGRCRRASARSAGTSQIASVA